MKRQSRRTVGAFFEENIREINRLRQALPSRIPAMGRR